ncbi:MAG: sulfatase-like hydrolase/transferase [Gammaproteobacteria bacterium]
MKLHPFSRVKLLIFLCVAPVILAACGGGGSVYTPQASATNSTITAAPSTVTADGTAAAAIIVNLLDTKGQPFTGSASVVISADPCTSCTLSYNNDNGTVTGTLSSSAAEDIVLGFTVNGESSPSMATVQFVAPPPPEPNILFIVFDDLGLDQLDTFGYGGPNPAATPNLDAIADVGVRFRNAWSMPECTPTRAMFYQGRYPFRTNMPNVIVSNTLANSQFSPFEVDTPKLLAAKGYESGYFGKWHLAGPDYNPYENGTPAVLGWNYFYGFIEGSPYPLDTTAGGVAPTGSYACGFVPDASQPGGADAGACYQPDNSCSDLTKTDTGIAPGLACVQAGGVFEPNAACQATPPSNLDFQTMNGYYVSPLVINNPDGSVDLVPPTDPRSREYRTQLEADAAIKWINSRPKGTPWMATLAFSAIHTPYQQPPLDMLPTGTPDNSKLSCTATVGVRLLANQMTAAIDYELARVLIQTGLATRNDDGSLNYNPAATNTWIVMVSDNGSYATIVHPPFDYTRAKGFVYQTGVWVPLIVAGPKVANPSREVSAMINVADLFELFGEIAGIDVHEAVPASHMLDSQPVMPYLTDPNQSAIRTTNFTETAESIALPGQKAPPCVVSVGSINVCLQVFPEQGLCEANAGIWYGPGSGACGSAGGDGCATCCDVKIYANPNVTLLAEASRAIRNDDYKLVVNQYPACIQPQTQYEFYQINEATPVPKLDTEDSDLLTSPSLPPQGLNDEELANFNALNDDLETLLATHIDCPGDGNEDMLVNQEDVDNWQFFSQFTGQQNSSWYDFNLDGLTNDQDLQIIEQNLGADCMPH